MGKSKRNEGICHITVELECDGRARGNESLLQQWEEQPWELLYSNLELALQESGSA